MRDIDEFHGMETACTAADDQLAKAIEAAAAKALDKFGYR